MIEIRFAFSSPASCKRFRRQINSFSYFDDFALLRSFSFSEPECILTLTSREKMRIRVNPDTGRLGLWLDLVKSSSLNDLNEVRETFKTYWLELYTARVISVHTLLE